MLWISAHQAHPCQVLLLANFGIISCMESACYTFPDLQAFCPEATFSTSFKPSRKKLSFSFLIFAEHARVLSHFSHVLTLFDPMDCSPPGSSVYEILQARILERVAMPSFKGSSSSGIKPASLMSPVLAGGFFTTSTTWESELNNTVLLNADLRVWFFLHI